MSNLLTFLKDIKEGHLKHLGLTGKFRVEEVQVIENILDELLYNNEEPTEDLISILSAYLGEIYIKNLNGKWIKSKKGQQEFLVALKDADNKKIVVSTLSLINEFISDYQSIYKTYLTHKKRRLVSAKTNLLSGCVLVLKHNEQFKTVNLFYRIVKK